MIVRPERPEDAAGVRAVLVDAFGQHAEATLVDALRADPSYLPGLALVAVVENGTIVGASLLTRGTVGGEPALALGPVGVASAHQGRGIGTALVEEGLRRARASRERLVFVLGDPSFYRRFSFVAATDVGIASPYPPRAPFQALPLTDDAPRGLAAYPGPFSRIDGEAPVASLP